ncbi:4Fe-4S binding protein [Pyrodictium abyssi]|uniref:NADH-quinone oxidoreductase subunit NuoI n=1 Tax=Pyrodictium abyssi TaxID=54256 RepID=A0ABN6ZR83_9CREN|nr:NADH-quinone oxidoreductase subunit NuoI [Pyrodictium abyssi]
MAPRLTEPRRRRPRVNPVRGHLEAILAAARQMLRPPITLRYPDVEEARPEHYRGIILFDYDKCIGCTLCAQICPSRAIKMYRVPGDKRMRPGYDIGRCIFCGLCTDICPTDALETSIVHDKSFEDVESMDLDPVDWALYSRKLREEIASPRKPRVKPVVDEEVGLRYEPAG